MRKLRILLLAWIPAAAWSQAVVEYGAAASATAGANAKTAGGIAGALSNLGKKLNTASDAKSEAKTDSAAASTTQAPKAAVANAKAGTAQPVVPAEAAPAKPAVVYEDPAGITEGMEQAELLRRFGEPAFKVSGGAGESLSFDCKDGHVDVEMRGGKVYSVRNKSKSR
jgi:hypothetical protein